jgi:hypothetical protein
MPNVEYDTRTPDEKKKLMKGKLKFDKSDPKSDGENKKSDVAEDNTRGNLHRHSA